MFHVLGSKGFRVQGLFPNDDLPPKTSRKPLRHDGTEKRSILSLWVLVPLEGTKMLVSGCRRFHHFSEGVGLHSTWKSCIPMSIKHTWNHKNLRRCLDVYTKCHCTFFVHWFIWRRLWIENVWEHEYSNQEVWKNCYQQWSHDGTIKMSTTTTLILIFCWQQGGHFTTKKKRFFVSNSWTAKYLVKVYQQLVKQIRNSSYEFETMLTRIATQTTGTW